jgi:hypothetical protein
MPIDKNDIDFVAGMLTDDPNKFIPPMSEGSTNRYYDSNGRVHPPTSDLYGDEMDIWGDFMVSYLNANKHVPADFKRYDAFPGSKNFDYIIASFGKEDEVAPSDHFDDFEDEYADDYDSYQEVEWIGEGSGPPGSTTDSGRFGYNHPIYDEFGGAVWFGVYRWRFPDRSGFNNLGTAGVWNHAWWVERY